MIKNAFPFTQVVGVDVAKAKLDFVLAEGQQPMVINNTRKEIVSKLIGRITSPENAIVVMEATGGYEEQLVTLLQQHNIALAVVNQSLESLKEQVKSLGNAKRRAVGRMSAASFTWQRWLPRDSIPRSKLFTGSSGESVGKLRAYW